ncbi:MAG: hypothetical protein ACPLQP_07085 [Moorellaceae bacterium]
MFCPQGRKTIGRRPKKKGVSNMAMYEVWDLAGRKLVVEANRSTQAKRYA